MRVLTTLAWCIAAAAALAQCGCGDKSGRAAATAALPTRTLTALTQPSLDAQPDVPLAIYLDVWQILVPAGSISRNDAFWRRIDESALDVAQYDLLYKNGIRVGVAPAGEWDYFKKIFQQNPATSSQFTFQNASDRNGEIEISKEIPGQDIFFFNRSNRMIGRTYDRCRNYWSLAFTPAPRQLGTTRLTLCPVVRTLRQRLEYSLNSEERELAFVTPEHIYDAGLSVDLPLGSFLVVAPSPEAVHWETSLGSRFLLQNAPAELQERILIFSPRLYRVQTTSPPR